MNSQDLILNYIFSYLKNTKNVRINNELTVGSRLQDCIIGNNSFTAGINNAARSEHSVAMGSNTEAGSNSAPENGNGAVALGEGTKAYSKYQLVHGKFNESDSNNIYAHIVGGGDSHVPKNIYTLDWEGKAWFKKGITIGDNKEEVITKEFFDREVFIKPFPATKVDSETIEIYANDFEPYTIYKAQLNNEYDKINFYVKLADGTKIPFLQTDSTVNKYNMFVSEKTDSEVEFIVNSVMYHINLNTGNVSRVIDKDFAGPSLGDGSITTGGALINDEIVDRNYAWSSHKISEELKNDFNQVHIANGELVFSRNGEVISSVRLPGIDAGGYPIDEEAIMRWNSKLDSPTSGGKAGQVLTLSDDNITPVWADPIGGGSGLTTTASQVSYIYGDDIKTVQDALNKLLYKEPVIHNFTADKSFGTYELGQVIDLPIIFNWNYTCYADLASITVTDVENPNNNSGSYTVAPIRDNKYFTLTITDVNGGKATLTRSYLFKQAVYYGTSLEPRAYDAGFVKGLAKKTLTLSNDMTLDFKADPGKYIYYCAPIEWGDPIFSSGGFDGGFEKIEEVIVTNDYGKEALYGIWISDNHSLGNVTIKVRSTR